jgi:hypothetical protein
LLCRFEVMHKLHLVYRHRFPGHGFSLITLRSL